MPRARRLIRWPQCLGCPIPADLRSNARPRPAIRGRTLSPRLASDRDRLDFSFSGLKTAVRYQIAGQGMPVNPSSLAQETIADLAASFQQAVIDCLIGKSLQALEKTGLSTLCVAGGVAANGSLRKQLEEACREREIALHVPPPKLCTDNAVMGALAIERLKAGLVESLDLNVYPGVVRGETAGGRALSSWPEKPACLSLVLRRSPDAPQQSDG